MNVPSLIITGLAAAFLFNYPAFLLFWHNPRYMLFQMPVFFRQGPDGQQETSKEDISRFRIFFYIAVIFVLLGAAVVCAATHDRTTNFWALFLYGYLVGMLVNIGDVLALDIWMLGKYRKYLTASCNVYPENWSLKNVLKKHTLPEHALQWTFIVCPVIGFVVAGLASGLLALGM